MATILYARVSSTEQTIEHQRTQAEQAGFKLDEVIADGGVSGVSTKLRERPQGRRLFDLLRNGDTLVVRWVDRLGSNYEDICETIREFMRRGVVIRTVINGITFDGATKDAMQRAVRDALIAFMAATAQAQAEATKEAQRAGIAHAKANGDGRPTRAGSRATAVSSSRARRRCWQSRRVSARSPGSLGSRGRRSTGSKMIPPGPKRLWRPGAFDKRGQQCITTAAKHPRDTALGASPLHPIAPALTLTSRVFGRKICGAGQGPV